MNNNFILGFGTDATILAAIGLDIVGILAPHIIMGYNKIYLHAGYDFIFGALYISPFLTINDHLALSLPMSIFGTNKNPVSIASRVLPPDDGDHLKYFQAGLALHYVF